MQCKEGFITWLGRVFLWVFLLPIGIWRSLVHHRKKGEKRAVEAMRRELDRREASEH